MKLVLGILAWGILMLATTEGMAASKAGSDQRAPATMRAPAVDDAWPKTRVGAVARGWVEAFCAGDSAMRSFYRSQMSDAGLSERGVGQRVMKYRELHERLGSLTLLKVIESSPLELKASLMAADASQHVFIFRIEKDAPQKLLSVSYMQKQTHGGGFFHH